MLKRYCELCGNQIKEKDFIKMCLERSNGTITEKRNKSYDICLACCNKIKKQISENNPESIND